jgi:hypothetical protein
MCKRGFSGAEVIAERHDRREAVDAADGGFHDERWRRQEPELRQAGAVGAQAARDARHLERRRAHRRTQRARVVVGVLLLRDTVG